MNKWLAGWLIDEWVIDGQMKALGPAIAQTPLIYMASIFKIHALNMDCGSSHSFISK